MALHISLLALTTLLIFSLQADAARPRKLADSPKSSSAPQSSNSDDDGDDGDDGDVSLSKILEKNGQFKDFLRLLDETHTADQIDNQLKNNNDQGMTVFAPTDNAFSNLKSGTMNSLTDQEKVQLVLYHVMPKYYNLTTLETASNPVRTQATGQNGRLWGLNITAQNNQVNVSSGSVVTPVNNALTQKPPLMVFEVSQVLLPGELFGSSKDSSESDDSTAASPPSSDSSAAGATAPAEAPEGSGASRKDLGLGLVGGLAGLVCLLAL